MVAALLVAMPLAAAYVDGPPPARTGGFGEPTCVECHMGFEPDPPGGSVSIEGIPDRYVPGRRYRVTVRVEHPGARAAGFQLAARFADGPWAGVSAGTLAPLDGRVRIVVSDTTGVAYAQHTRAGTRTVEDGAAVWRFAWTAPCAAAPATFHVAANAADDDASEFGDRIYLAETGSRSTLEGRSAR